MFTEKVYECACPVCHAATRVVSSFFSAGMLTFRAGIPGVAYPASVCPGVHTRAEVSRAMGFPIRPGKDPNEIIGRKHS